MNKHQTPAQRIANAVWLREQIEARVKETVALIREDQSLAEHAGPEETDRYLGRIESHRYWKRQLERILRGRTIADELSEGIAP